MADRSGYQEETRMQEGVAMDETTNHDEPVATKPLKPVVYEKDLNSETVLYNKDYGTDMESQASVNASKVKLDSSARSDSRGSDSETSAAGNTVVKHDQSPAPLQKSTRRLIKWLSFGRATIPPVPKERQVSREYTANIFSIISFQWMQPLMSVGYQRQLEHNDLWQVNPNRRTGALADRMAASFKMRVARKDKRPLLGAMYETFKFEFILGGACQLLASILMVINPYILKYLITFAAEAYEAHYNPAYPFPAPNIGRGVGIVITIACIQLIQNGCTNQFLYRGMMNGGQSRAALISLIFDKSMKISGRAKAGGKSLDASTADSLEEMPSDIKPGTEEEKRWFKRKLGNEKKAQKDAKKKAKKDKGKPGDQEGVSGDGQGWGNGRIVNLMSVDTYRIDQASGMFHMIWTSPVTIIVTLVLLLVNLSYSALSGFALIVVCMPILGRSIKALFRRRKAINKITDQRVSLTQEILAAVRFVKYFGWEESFLQRLEDIRSREIGSIQFLLAIRNAIMSISMAMPVFASMLAFITYSLSNHGLAPASVFSSLALFNGLRMPLNLLPLVIGQVVDAVSSVGRIQEFLLAEEETDAFEWDKDNKDAVVVRDAAFTWERSKTKDNNNDATQEKQDKKDAKQKKKDAKKARNDQEKGGNRASEEDQAHEEPPFQIRDLNFSVGRGELIAVIGSVGSGKSSLLAALAGDMRKTQGSITIGASRAFCPQYAWIQNATVKENILFGKEMDKEWYNKVVEACALGPDMDMLPNGDLTEIGERGITVSGGQKQRLNIARAIYFDCDMVLMDDPLSAVDAHVGRHIMDEAICGLLKNKCRVLATHQLWVLNRCDRIMWMDQGKITAIDTFDNLMANSPEFAKLIANNAQEEKQEEDEQIDGDEIAEEKKEVMVHNGGKPAVALMQTEERAGGSVATAVYMAYFNASGNSFVVPLVLLLLILAQGSNIVTSLWLSWWTQNKFAGFTNGEYIGIYAALGASQALLQFVFSLAITYYATQASKVMLHRAVTRVLRAPMSFFDTTPLGRITNRFSRDIDTMDNVLADAYRFFLITLGTIIAVFILIIAYYYYFAAALVPLAIIFVFAASFYRASAREVKRHESVLRSVVFSRFSEAVSGIATIRAYGLQERFSMTLRDAIDEMDSAYFLTFSNQRWLSVRLDFIGTLLVFIVGILVVTSRFSVSPSTGGLVLAYILSIVQMLTFTIRQLAEVENNMNATERIHYYGTALEEEPPLHLGNVRDSWPEHGEIVFDSVQMKYRDGLPLVLRGLSMHVKGGERIGVVGRTGAGKSSIMTALFRLVDLSSGSISIDGINISTIGLHDLRSKLAIIPQDPTLFRGTVRSNLDPFNKYTDLELWSALRQADLVESDATMDDKSGRVQLDSPVEEEGLNFSLGQRQLMALARALVRGSQIIVCDEATSSVDMETDQRIQRTIQMGFRGKTLLCIAHRLKTIIHYDRICVMDNGTIAELDTPLALFERPESIFRKMCDKSSIRREDFNQTE